VEALGLVLAAEAAVAVTEAQEDRTGLCQTRTFIFQHGNLAHFVDGRPPLG
jgi:hypothetical protein